MAGPVSDEAFARAVQQAGVVSYDQIEAAKAAQAESATATAPRPRRARTAARLPVRG